MGLGYHLRLWERWCGRLNRTGLCITSSSWYPSGVMSKTKNLALSSCSLKRWCHVLLNISAMHGETLVSYENSLIKKQRLEKSGPESVFVENSIGQIIDIASDNSRTRV